MTPDDTEGREHCKNERAQALIGRFGISRSSIFALPAIAGGAVALWAGEPGPAAMRSGAAPDFEIHYAPEENLEAIDAELIGGAQRSLDVMAYVLTDRTVFGAFEDAARRGVKVRIWRDVRMAAELGDVDLTDPASLLEIRASHGAELMHLKGYCVDGAILRTGSANFSHSGERYQDNDLVILRGPNACAGFEAKFARAWGAMK
jgi:phosphatidylserine/phosphatidylglycerophosphate/cardiolipin synthase-like enzyme